MNHRKRYTSLTWMFFFYALTASPPLLGGEPSGNDPPAPKKTALSGFLDFNGYYDTRDFNVITLNLLANLPYRFQYASLTNYFNAIGTGQNFDFDAFYTEQNLRWGLPWELPLDLTFQGVIRSAQGNDLARFGCLWRLSATPVLKKIFEKIHMSYFINFHLLQTDFDDSPGWGWQIEHLYRIDILPGLFQNRLYLGGFADHNMSYGGAAGGDNHQWVTEHQLGVRLINWLYAVAEFRRNEFSATKKTGVGLGLEYAIKF